MKDKYTVDHEISFTHFIKNRIKIFRKETAGLFVKPLNTTIKAIFVVGCGHSGTTLVAAKLGNNSCCHLIGHETRNFKPYNGYKPASLVAQQWIDTAQILHKTCFIEKTPKHIHTTAKIKKILPDAQFLVMTRNPLDNCASLYQRFRDLEYSIDRWLMDNKAATKLNARHAFLIKYENVTSSPISTFKQICDFLDINFEESMLAEQQTAYDTMNQTDNMQIRTRQVSEKIRKNIGSWKKKLSEKQALSVLKKCMPLADRLGYTEEYLLHILHMKQNT